MPKNLFLCKYNRCRLDKCPSVFGRVPFILFRLTSNTCSFTSFFASFRENLPVIELLLTLRLTSVFPSKDNSCGSLPLSAFSLNSMDCTAPRESQRIPYHSHSLEPSSHLLLSVQSVHLVLSASVANTQRCMRRSIGRPRLLLCVSSQASAFDSGDSGFDRPME